MRYKKGQKLVKFGAKIAIIGFAFQVCAGFFVPLPVKAASLTLAAQKETTKAEEMLVENIKQKLKHGTYFVLGIEAQLKNSGEELNLLKNNIQAIEEKIDESHVQSLNLQSQISNLDKLIARNTEKIAAVRLQIAENSNEILVMEDNIKHTEKELGHEVASLDNALSNYYLQNNVFFSPREDTANLLAFMASDEDTGAIMRENEYLFFMQNASQDLAGKIMNLQGNLDAQKMALQIKKRHMADFQTLLAGQNKNLADMQRSKERLMEETRGKQAIYEALLEISKKEEEQVALQIDRLKENFSFFQAKLDELKNMPGANGIDLNGLAYSGDLDPILSGNAALAWPVSPGLGLSAFFHDEAYKNVMGIAHNAVDIRITQGSNVKSASDGVVSKVADNGFGYSYVIIAHPDKLLTLYGHLSEIFVNEGEVVRQGQTIGLSGGIPGTKGAGWLTTGAHLHFEVFKDFQHVDPLNYLPLEFVPVVSLPEKYIKKMTGEESDRVLRMNK